MCAETFGYEQLAEIRRITDEKRAAGDDDAYLDFLTTALRLSRVDERLDLVRGTLLNALMRLDQGALSGLLGSPCIWCGYNGASYWQAGSHEQSCPWHDIASSQSRLEVLTHGPGMATDRAAEIRRHWERIAAPSPEQPPVTDRG